MQLQVGQIVSSRAGRDVTRFYVVVGVAQGRVLLANGEKFTLQNPKQKNHHHLAPTKTILSPQTIQTNNTLKAALAAYTAAHGPRMQGG